MKLLKFKYLYTAFFLFVLLSGTAIQLVAQKGSADNPPHYIFPEFVNGKVIMKSGSIKNSLLNYNTVTQEMIFEQKGKYLALDKTEAIDTVIIEGRSFVPVGKVFYEVALIAPVSLFIEHKSDITSKGKSIGYGAKKQTTSSTAYSKLIASDGLYELKLPEDFYITNTSINWIQTGDRMVKFVTKRQFLKIFPQAEDELKLYIKENKTDMKSREDLIRLVRYCNELILKNT